MTTTLPPAAAATHDAVGLITSPIQPSPFLNVVDAPASPSSSPRPQASLSTTQLRASAAHSQQPSSSSRLSPGRLASPATAALPSPGRSSREAGSSGGYGGSSRDLGPSSGRKQWDCTPTLPQDLSFEAALAAWCRDLDLGVFAPKLVGPLAAVDSGTLVRPDRRHNSTATVFAGGRALEAFEALVTTKLVCRPGLTLLQLQRALEALASVDAAAQLVVAALLLRHGFYMSAMRLAYEDWEVLWQVLLEARALVSANIDEQNEEVSWAC